MYFIRETDEGKTSCLLDNSPSGGYRLLDMVAYKKLKVPKQFMVGAMEVKKSYMPYFEPLYAKIVENRWAGVEAAEKLKVNIQNNCYLLACHVPAMLHISISLPDRANFGP